MSIPLDVASEPVTEPPSAAMDADKRTVAARNGFRGPGRDGGTVAERDTLLTASVTGGWSRRTCRRRRRSHRAQVVVTACEPSLIIRPCSARPSRTAASEWCQKRVLKNC
ncbi:hypothetical protein Aab01nite_79470 [Paractinoplanes abujensis]|nr:hypothetical protein Aab01nite_79470 [Actinoplanes abujensis]